MWEKVFRIIKFILWLAGVFMLSILIFAGVSMGIFGEDTQSPGWFILLSFLLSFAIAVFVAMSKANLQVKKTRKSSKKRKTIVKTTSKVPDTASLSKIDNMNGHEFEHFVAHLLEKNGYTNIEVMRGSGDQGIDVLAMHNGFLYGFQCKRYKSNVGNSSVQEAAAGKSFYRCNVAVVITNQHFTKSAVELANIAGVMLWDREKQKELIEKAR